MKTIIYSAIPNNGVIKIPLLTECTCEIGLVSLSLLTLTAPPIVMFIKKLMFCVIKLILHI